MSFLLGFFVLFCVFFLKKSSSCQQGTNSSTRAGHASSEPCKC